MIRDGGGLNNAHNFFKKTLGIKNKTIKYNNFWDIYKNIIDRNKNFYLFIGYADLHIIFGFIVSLFTNNKIIYLPAFHPWKTMRRKYLAYIYEKFILKFVLNKSKLILCLSNKEKNILKKINPKSNIKVIKMSSSILNKQKINFNKSRNSIIFVGRDDYSKNLTKFICISKKIRKIKKNYKFIIVSDTNRELPDYIFVKRNLTKYQLLKIYENSLAIIVPSLWESFSIAGLEAIFMGSKLICNQNVMLGSYAKKYPSLILKTTDDISRIMLFLNSKIKKTDYKSFIFDFSDPIISRDINKHISTVYNLNNQNYEN